MQLFLNFILFVKIWIELGASFCEIIQRFLKHFIFLFLNFNVHELSLNFLKGILVKILIILILFETLRNFADLILNEIVI